MDNRGYRAVHLPYSKHMSDCSEFIVDNEQKQLSKPCCNCHEEIQTRVNVTHCLPILLSVMRRSVPCCDGFVEVKSVDTKVIRLCAEILSVVDAKCGQCPHLSWSSKAYLHFCNNKFSFVDKQ